MKLETNLQKAISAASLMNTIFGEYQAGDLNKSSELVRKRVAKFMRQRNKTNRNEFMEVIKKTDEAWRMTINHFADKKLKIEAKTTISSIYRKFEKEMNRFVNINDKHIEKFAIGATDDAEAEMNSDTVVDYIAGLLGVENERSAFAGKRLAIVNNMILSGEKIDDKFLKSEA